MFSTWLLIATVAVTVGDQAGSYDTNLSRYLRERRGISSGELLIHVRFAVSKTEPASVNSEWNYHYWFDSNRGIYRIDKQVVGDRHYDVAVHSERFCFDGSESKYIDEVETLRPLRQYSYVPNPGPDVFDPRILGLFIVPFSVLQHFKLDDVRDIIEGASSVKRSEEGGRIREEYSRGDKSKNTYIFDHNSHLVGSEYVSAEGKPDQRYMADIIVQRYRNSFDFPRTIHFVESRRGVAYVDESIELEIVQFNEPIDPSVFYWSALAPKAGARLVVNNDYSHQSAFWDGRRFQRVPKFLIDNLTADLLDYHNRMERRKILVILCISIAGSLFLLYVYRQIRTHRLRDGHART